MSDPEQAAVSALREATRALGVGEQAASDAASEHSREPDVALEVAQLLEAMVRLLRSTELDAVPRASTSHRLHAVVQHLSAGAELARRTDRGEGEDLAPSSHPETGRGVG